MTDNPALTHDLRNAVGYRHIPAADAEEQRLRDELFYARGKLAEAGEEPDERLLRAVASCDKRLCDYIWERACQQVAADRAKHPKAKRNMPVGSALPQNEKAGTPETPHIPGFTQDDPRGLAK